MVKLKSEKYKGYTLSFTKLSSGKIAMTLKKGNKFLARKSNTKTQLMRYARRYITWSERWIKNNPKATIGDFKRAEQKLFL